MALLTEEKANIVITTDNVLKFILNLYYIYIVLLLLENT